MDEGVWKNPAEHLPSACCERNDQSAFLSLRYLELQDHGNRHAQDEDVGADINDVGHECLHPVVYAFSINVWIPCGGDWNALEVGR